MIDDKLIVAKAFELRGGNSAKDWTWRSGFYRGALYAEMLLKKGGQ